MGYRHSEEDLLEAAVAVALDQGLAAVTFASVGTRAGVRDRTVVYYFPDKATLIGTVVAALGKRLQGVLAEAFGDTSLPLDELMKRSWPVLATPETDPLFAVFLQVLGFATAGVEPYASLAVDFVDGWITWLAPRVDAPTPASRRRSAAAAMAQLDGLLLLRSVAGATLADGAARELGVLPSLPPGSPEDAPHRR
jgi:AcrR family transcriptional regulator